MFRSPHLLNEEIDLTVSSRALGLVFACSLDSQYLRGHFICLLRLRIGTKTEFSLLERKADHGTLGVKCRRAGLHRVTVLVTPAQ